MRRRVFDAATTVGLKALDGKIRGGPAKGLRFHGGDTLGYLLGRSEPAVQGAMVRYLPAGGVFFDVGANIGFHTVLGRRLVGPAGQVHVFEPLEENLAQLRRNLDANGFDATIHPVALSDRAGSERMIADGLLGRARFGQGERMVETARLDDLALPIPDLVKIDVEGAEELVIEGMGGMLSHRPAMVIETHGTDREVERLLVEHGYAVERLDDGGMPHLIAR